MQLSDKMNTIKFICAGIIALVIVGICNAHLSDLLKPHMGLWVNTITLPLSAIAGWNIAKYIGAYYKPKKEPTPTYSELLHYIAAYYDCLSERFNCAGGEKLTFVYEDKERGRYDVEITHTPPKQGKVIEFKPNRKG